MAAKKKKAKTYPQYSKDHAPRDLSQARVFEGLRRTNPIEWREKILAAVRQVDGNVGEAADLLGLGRRSITRYMTEDAALHAGIENIRTQARAKREKATADA